MGRAKEGTVPFRAYGVLFFWLAFALSGRGVRAASEDGLGGDSFLLAPRNDKCMRAQEIPPDGPFPFLTHVVDIAGATIDGDPPDSNCGGTTRSRSVWYKFTPAVRGFYSFSMCSDVTATTVGDTIAAIYVSQNGCMGPFTQLAGACDDDSCSSGDLQSRLIKKVLDEATTYYIVVWEKAPPSPPLAPKASNLQVRTTISPRPPPPLDAP